MAYNFSTQKELFHIAYQILQDYSVSDWSFGGGTALSSLYYGHRMSYDIDIFSEDYSGIQTIIAAQKEITQNLGTSEGLDYKKILKLNKAKIEKMLSNGG